MKFIVLLSAFLSFPALAGPIHRYAFDVTATTGPLAGETSTGTFSYESPWDTCVPNCGVLERQVLGLEFTDFEFTWGGLDYAPADPGAPRGTRIGAAILGDSGVLDTFWTGCFGSRGTVGGCGVGIFQPDWRILFGQDARTLGVEAHFLYSDGVTNGQGFAALRYLGRASVPEPATFMSLAVGLLMLWRLRG